MAYNPQRKQGGMRQNAMRHSWQQRRNIPRTEEFCEQADIPPYISDHPHASPQGSPLAEEIRNLLTGWDGERLALLGLLYFLYKEGADAKLLLAIAYIIL